jgi:probable F420-dependent oxidoreductase
MGDIKLGIMPAFKEGVITDPRWCHEFAEMVEAEGVESIWTVEHVVVAKDYEPRYSYSESGRMPGAPGSGTVMPDPLETLAFFAACTERVRLGTAVLVLTLHQPAIVAKRVATIDNLSQGRVSLGVGSGWQIEEYRACGVPYEGRGRRLDDAIVALRELWQPGYRTHRGEFFEFVDCESLPTPVQAGGPPIIIGGSTEIAARRAGRLGDGFYPYVISPEDLAKRVETIHTTAREHGRDPDAIEITVWPGSWKPGSTLDLDVVRRFTEVGAHRMTMSAQESGATEVSQIRDLVRRVQDEVISNL